MVTQAEDKFNTGHSGGTAGGGGKTPESQTPSNTKPFFLLSELETSSINSANVFNSHHKGGRLTFINPHLSVDSTKYPDSDWNKPTQWVSPFEVVDSKKVEIIFPYSITSKQGGDFVIPEEMSNLSFSMSFEPIEDEDSQVTSSIYQASYADITIGNLRTYSGDVHRAKIFSKRQGQTSNAFIKVADFLLQPDNALVNTESVSGRQPIGFFFTQSIVDKYWESSSADVSVTTRDTYLVGGISLSGSNENEGASYTFKTKNNMVFEKREDYEVVFDLQYFKSDKSGSYGSSDDENPENISAAQSHAEIEVFLSGSIESENPDVEYSLGRLSSVPTDPDFTDLLSSESGSIRRVYNIFRTHGLENQISSGSLGFRISSGRFDISNISVSPFADQNFNPGFGKISIPMPLNDEAEVRYDFIAEFYDHNNNKSIQTAQTSASVLFNGPRKVISITGDDVWDGTATIGSSMLLHGSNPAFLASVGYKGFEKARAGAAGAADGGLLLFSGSIGSGADTNFLTASEAYDGVGIEIVDASAGSGNPGQHKFLRFRSKDPDNSGNASFRVQTDEFYFGQDRSVAGAQFVSGSEGNIEISSSNFHLDNDGSVVMQGSITATAGGQIGGFTITDKAISTTDFFLSGSTYSGTGFQNTNLVLSSSGFQINSDGQISASEGAIGGFGIGASSLSATGFFISGSSTGTGFADTNLFISSSGFQVNAVGAISASSGVIGGFGISKDSISDTAVTPKFFISGSPGATNNMADTNLFISASGFQVNSTGEISASAGVIGGFGVSKDSISDTAGTPKFFISGSPGETNNMEDTNLFISASDFQVNSSGEVSASAGVIGGWSINDTTLTGGVVTLNSAGSIEVGGLENATTTATTNAGFFADSSGNVLIKGTSNNANYLKFNGTSIDFNANTFNLTTDYLQITDASAAAAAGKIVISGTDQHIKVGTGVSIDGDGDSNAGQITVGGNVTLNGSSDSTIGGWTIGTSTFTGGNITLNSAGTIKIKDVTGVTDTTSTREGVFIDNDGDILIKGVDGSSNKNYIQQYQGDLTIQTRAFNLNTDNLDINSTDKRISIFEDSAEGGQEIVRIGELTDTNTYGLTIFDGVDTNSDNVIAKLGTNGNLIGGWEITNSQIRTKPAAGFGGAYAAGEEGLILQSDGRVETANFATNVSGWRIDEGGFAEFESARIRGTLKTTVFEKETVNAVGGQLMIANSTALEPLRDVTGSIVFGYDEMSSTFPTMSSLNVSGFSVGEILKAKKISDTGFSVEYLKISGIQRYSDDSTGSPTTASVFAAIDNISDIDPDGLSGELHFEVNGSGNRSISGFDPSNATDSSPSGSAAKTTLSTSTINTTVTSFDVADASDFSVQDIIKIGNAKTDERMKITAISSNTLTVVRDWGGTTAQSHASSDPVWLVDTDKEFKMDLVSTPVSYTAGQVFVSTGKYDAAEEVSTGYILLNANPNDAATPYMDIVERTGSGVYDLQLRSRIGDLSGLSSGFLYGDEEPGFGIFTENGFFRGSITAETGSITGRLFVDTSTTQKLVLGTDVPNGSSGNDGLYINANNYWYTTGDFKVGDTSNNFVKFETSPNSKVSINADEIVLDTTGNPSGLMKIDSPNETIRLGDVTDFTNIGNGGSTDKGIFFGKESSGNYDFFVGDKNGNYLWYDDSSGNLNIKGTINIGSVTGLGAFTGSTNSHTGSVNSTTGSINSFTGSYETQVQLSSAGMKLLDLNTPIANTLADFGTDIHLNVGTIYVGNTGSNATTGDWVEIDSTSIEINRNGQTSMSLDANGITIGDTSTDYLDINATSIDMYRNGNPEISLTNGKVVVAANTTAPTIDSVVVEGGQGVKIYDSSTAYSHISATGLDVYQSSNNVASFGDTIRVGRADEAHQTISSTQTQFLDGDGSTVRLQIANDGIIDLRDSGGNVKVEANTTGVKIIGDNTSTFGLFKAGGLTFVDNNVTGSLFTSTKATIFGGSNDDRLEIDSSGLDVYKDGQVSMSLEAGGVKVGPTASQHISIDSDSLDVKTDASNIVASFGASAVIGKESSTTSHLKIITGDPTTGNNGMSYQSSDGDSLMFVGVGSEMQAHSETIVTGGANRPLPNGYNISGLYAGNLMATELHVQDIDVSGSIDLSYTGTNAQQITAPVVNITSGDNFSLGELTNTLRMKGNSTDGFNFLNSSNGWADLNFRRGIAATDMSISGSAKVTGSLYAQGLKISGSTGVGNQVMIHVDDNTNTYFQVLADGEVIARDNISAFAGASAFTSISDERLKKDVHTMSGSMNKILQLRPTEFTWKDNNKEDAGFIAQEVEKILPDVVYETKGFVDIESGKQGDTKYKTIAYSKLTTYLVDTIQQLNKRIEELEKNK